MNIKEIWNWSPYKPYHQTLRGRVTRVLCSAVNHYPRFDGGSWCQGYGYVCDRCGMNADPMTDSQMRHQTKLIELEDTVQWRGK